jgi:hypothetical protein
MPQVKAQVRRGAVTRRVFESRAATKRVSGVVRNSAERAARKANDKMVKEFLNHKVTQEISRGPAQNSKNISDTLGGYGNLFSFVGFEKGSDPILPVAGLLENSIRVNSVRKARGKNALEVSVQVPDKEVIFAATPMPWAVGRSWTKGIEEGISGLGRYFFSGRTGFKGSRSGHAIQTENLDTATAFKNVPYISALIRNAAKDVIDRIRRRSR